MNLTARNDGDEVGPLGGRGSRGLVLELCSHPKGAIFTWASWGRDMRGMRCGWGRCTWRDRDFSLLEVGDHPCVASGPVLVHRSRDRTLGTGSRPARRPHGHERLEDVWVRVGLGPRDTFRRQLLGGRGVVGGGRCLSLNRAQEHGAGGRSRRAESRLPGRAARARGPCAPPAAPGLEMLEETGPAAPVG